MGIDAISISVRYYSTALRMTYSFHLFSLSIKQHLAVNAMVRKNSHYSIVGTITVRSRSNQVCRNISHKKK